MAVKSNNKTCTKNATNDAVLQNATFGDGQLFDQLYIKFKSTYFKPTN